MQSFPSFLDRLSDPVGNMRSENLQYLQNAAFGLISMENTSAGKPKIMFI